MVQGVPWGHRDVFGGLSGEVQGGSKRSFEDISRSSIGVQERSSDFRSVSGTLRGISGVFKNVSGAFWWGAIGVSRAFQEVV